MASEFFCLAICSFSFWRSQPQLPLVFLEPRVPGLIRMNVCYLVVARQPSQYSSWFYCCTFAACNDVLLDLGDNAHASQQRHSPPFACPRHRGSIAMSGLVTADRGLRASRAVAMAANGTAPLAIRGSLPTDPSTFDSDGPLDPSPAD